MTCKKEADCVHGVGCFLKDEWDVARCSAFKRKPQEMTNEKYLKSLSTEQLAEWIVNTNRCKKDHLCLVCKLKLCDKNAVMEWLKQPHQGVIA